MTERQHVADCLSRRIFAHLPQATAKQAQSSWRIAAAAADDCVGEIVRIVDVAAPRKSRGA